MPPDTAIVMDQSWLGEPFYNVFNAVDDWQKRPDRNLNELPGIIGKIPELQDIDIDGRSVLGIYRNYRASRGSDFVPEDEDGLEDLLQAAVPGRPGVPPGPDERPGASSTMPGGRSASRPIRSRASSTSP